MPDIVSLGIGFAGVVMVPLGAVIKKSYTNDKRLTVLETNAENSETAIVRIEAKLDRLIERFL